MFLFRQIQYQIIVITAILIRLTDLIFIPDAAPVRNVSALDIHPLGASVSAVQTHSEVYHVRIRKCDLFRNIHEPAADSSASVFLQNAEVNDLSIAPANAVENTT